ncbi:predicted protein [Nematostella vectensis]|uniref:Peptidase A2 domain-containing protein n=1 Tax=Nematostella vectensis TaxID=45351 RepID=A7SCL4_NEMVE|nr:predicted protein [Nematostella vectensis]|eukprot:XP_001630577.1 predicted protein [Nematostella vectensis]
MNANEVTQPQGDQRFFLGDVESDGTKNPWTVDLLINQKPVNFKVDTGADITVLSESTYNHLPNPPKLEPERADISSPGGKLICKGQFLTGAQLNGEAYQVKMFVIAGEQVNNLLGRETACKMGLVQRVGEVLFDVFGDIGLLNCAPVKIELREGA